MNEDELRESRLAEGALAHRILEDGRELTVYSLTYGRARLGIGPAGEQWFDDVY